MTEPETAGSDPTPLRTPRGPRRRRVGHQRPQVVLHQRLDRRLPDRHGGHRPRRAAAPARVDVHRPGRHAGREHRPRRRRRWSTREERVRQARRPRRDPLRGRPRARPTRCSATRAPASSSPSTASGPGASTTACAGSASRSRAFDMLCERALYREARGAPLAEKQTVQNWIADSRGRRCTPRG